MASEKGYDIAEGGKGSTDEHPVHGATWYDAVKWCNLKSENAGLPPHIRSEAPPTKPATSLQM